MRIIFVVVTLLFTSSVANADLKYEALKDKEISVLIVNGIFEYEDDLSFFIKAVSEHNASAIMFNSGGGNIYKAMELGKLIRVLKLDTLQPRGMDCSSACSLAFLGGVMRIAEAGSIGVHKSSFNNSLQINANDAVSSIQKTTADIMSFIAEMGADANLLQLALQYDSDDMRYLSLREMENFKVVTVDKNKDALSDSNNASTLTYRTAPQTAPSSPTPPPASFHQTYKPNLTIPNAQSGIVHHPKRKVAIKFDPNTKSQNLIELRNGASIYLQRYDQQWYKVAYGDYRGYMHHSWVHVDQYELPRTERRYIQISSFATYDEALAFLNQSDLKLDVYLSTNRWLAVTLRGSFSYDDALSLTKLLKAQGKIPQDSIIHYGNTYIRKL